MNIFRRNREEEDRGERSPVKRGQVAQTILRGVETGIRKVMPKGFRHPDSMVQNKHLYMGASNRSIGLFQIDKNMATIGLGGKSPELISGLKPKMDVSLFVNTSKPKPKKSKPKKNTYNQQLAKIRRKLWG